MSRFPRFRRTIVGAAGAALTLILPGCGSMQDGSGFFADPGGYAIYTCPQLADRIAAIEKEGQRLQEMMARADRDASGPLINSIAYEPDYLTNRAAMREIKKSAAAKNCPPPPPAMAKSDLIR